ncbi:F0F1 ATP synthase subunit delta [Brevibacillus humidisoli]|uniref:F0F1 ATP synthase subunit delta n=1 Tax=Brevibacillus humidisoli TaxID=2895522 RepID=UPI001E459DBD|nr:F0F1 ATP synthase subunit delta [Brevibacillus humidisoli]UFJ40165.1 F0F1 ATP synthase subunit delta [Brevibacillus humidisoli]
MSGAVAKRYARALFEVANERGLIDAVEAEVKLAAVTLQTNEEVASVMTHPQIPVEEKKQLVSDLFQAHLSQETLNLLLILIENGRQSQLSDIAKAYVTLANEARGIVDAVVTTAKPLSEPEQAEIAEQFGKVLDRTLRVQTVVNPAILGGVVVQIGDRLYDGSLKTKLERFAHQV